MEIVFQRPYYLIFLLSIPLVIYSHYYFLKHTKRKAMKFANFAAIKRVTGEKLLTKNTHLLILRCITLLFLILSVAHPVLWMTGNVNYNDYVIAIDASASMTSDDIYPDRLRAAKQASLDFVDSLDSKTQVGVVTFAGISFINLMLTSDVGQIKDAIQSIDTIPAGGTDIGAALINSANLLMQGRKSKKIILLTDGTDTAGFAVDDGISLGLEYAKAKHIQVYTIGVGTEEGGKGNLPDDIDIRYSHNKEQLQRIAQDTGGMFFEAQDQDAIDQAFASIDSQSEKGKVSYEMSYGFLFLSLILIFVEWGLINTKFRVIP